MKSILRFLLVMMIGVAVRGQTYDSPYVRVLGDGRSAPTLPPVSFIPEMPPDPEPWGPRAFVAFGKMQNSSFRASVAPGEEVVGGIVVGSGRRILLIRAIGPSLRTFGIAGFLTRPQLRVFDAAGALVAGAVSWSTNPEAVRNELKDAARAVGAFPLLEGSEDQVLLLFLEQGSYTCAMRGLSNAPGTVLLEIYDVPSQNRST